MLVVARGIEALAEAGVDADTLDDAVSVAVASLQTPRPH